MAVWDELKRFAVTYQKAKACIINTSLAEWIAVGDRPKVPLWIQIDVQYSWKKNLSGKFCFLMHQGSLQTNASNMVISLGLRASVLQSRAETCHAACFEFWGQVRKWSPVTLTVTSLQCEERSRHERSIYAVKIASEVRLQTLILIPLHQMCAYNGENLMLNHAVIIWTH